MVGWREEEGLHSISVKSCANISIIEWSSRPLLFSYFFKSFFSSPRICPPHLEEVFIFQKRRLRCCQKMHFHLSTPCSPPLETYSKARKRKKSDLLHKLFFVPFTRKKSNSEKMNCSLNCSLNQQTLGIMISRISWLVYNTLYNQLTHL